MGCYSTKQLKKSIQNMNQQNAGPQTTKEIQLKNEILLLRNCLFKILDMKSHMKSLISIQQDICIIKMKKRNEENLEEILRCYEQNVKSRAQQILAILKEQENINSDTSLMQRNRVSVYSTCKNDQSKNTNYNPATDVSLFQNQDYDIYHVLRYSSPLGLEEDLNTQTDQREEAEEESNHIELQNN